MRFLIIFCPATDTTFMSNSQHNHNVAKELSPEIGVSSEKSNRKGRSKFGAPSRTRWNFQFLSHLLHLTGIGVAPAPYQL